MIIIVNKILKIENYIIQLYKMLLYNVYLFHITIKIINNN